jgi:transcription elongation GreA/GreB family factor
MSFKQKIFNALLQSLNEKIDWLKNDLAEMKASKENETKSTAGDKHETARAIAQTKEDQLNTQLNETLSQKAQLEAIDISQSHSIITKGSVVQTNKGYFYISVALGKITVDDIVVFSLSAQSPLGSKLMGLKINDTVAVNGVGYFVEGVL